jgi:hypothetical protein
MVVLPTTSCHLDPSFLEHLLPARSTVPSQARRSLVT